MIRLALLFFSVFATSLSLPSVASAKEGAAEPNILFIYTDDHSYRTVSCYEGAESWARTPNMDKLAARGVQVAHDTVWRFVKRAGQTVKKRP